MKSTVVWKGRYSSNEFPIHQSLKRGDGYWHCCATGHLEGSSKPGGVEMD